METELSMAVNRQNPAIYVGLRHGFLFAPRQLAESFAEVSEVRGIEREYPQALLQIALPACLPVRVIPTLHDCWRRPNKRHFRFDVEAYVRHTHIVGVSAFVQVLP